MISYYTTLSPNMPAHGDKNLGIFVDGIIIRHAGYVVADGPLHAVKTELGMKILRQGFGIFHVIFNELAERYISVSHSVCKIRKDIKVAPNVGVPIFMFLEYGLAYSLAKNAEKEAERQPAPRLKRR